MNADDLHPDGQDAADLAYWKAHPVEAQLRRAVNRVTRLEMLNRRRAPDVIIEKERELIRQALAEFDRLWAEGQRQ